MLTSKLESELGGVLGGKLATESGVPELTAGVALFAP